MALYGFISAEERELFKNLINISGIGPKSAIGILSAIRFNRIKKYDNRWQFYIIKQSSWHWQKTSEESCLN